MQSIHLMVMSLVWRLTELETAGERQAGGEIFKGGGVLLSTPDNDHFIFN